ncbi:MAG: rod-binding protein [Treponema sp.]|nr:rod-binding protein [Treponema sp.]
MAVQGVSGTGVTGTLSGSVPLSSSFKADSEKNRFEQLVKQLETSQKQVPGVGVASSQVATGSRLNGDYKQGFYGLFTSEADRRALPQGMAANATTKDGKKAVIDKTSDLYAQSLEMENYFVKMMLSAARKTVQKSPLTGENSYASEMYEGMLYDNYAEAFTKNARLGLADQIYLELSRS